MNNAEPEARIWLAISHEDRQAAVVAGGKLADGRNAITWSKEDQLWYARPGVDPERIKPWLPDRTLRSGGGDPESEFYDVLASEGLILNGLPVMDGKRHRVATVEDKHGTKSGVYRGYLDGRPAGWFINYHRAETEKSVTNWKASGSEADPHVRLHIRAGMRQSQDDAARERAMTYAKQTAKAKALYDRLPPADNHHPYLQRKGITATDDLRQTRNGALVVPFFDVEGDFRTLQYIPPEGEKYLFADAPKVGNFLVVGAGLRGGEPILYAEGYATARSLNLASGLPVVMTIDAGNMQNVASILKARYPTSPHIFMADMDQRKDVNKGLLSAIAAAEKTEGVALIPAFTEEEVSRGLTDFNDLHHSRGLDGLRDYLETNLTQALNKLQPEKYPMKAPSDAAVPAEQLSQDGSGGRKEVNARSGSAKEKAPQVHVLAAQGMGSKEIAEQLGIGLSSVYRILKAPPAVAEQLPEVAPNAGIQPAVDAITVLTTESSAAKVDASIPVLVEQPTAALVTTVTAVETSPTSAVQINDVSRAAAPFTELSTNAAEQAHFLQQQGRTLVQIAAELNVGVSQAHRLLQDSKAVEILAVSDDNTSVQADTAPVITHPEPATQPVENEPEKTAGEMVNQAEAFLEEWRRDINKQFPPRENSNGNEFTDAFADIEKRMRTLLKDADTLSTEQFTSQLSHLMYERKGLTGIWMSSDEAETGVEPDKNCLAIEAQLEARMEQKFESEEGKPAASAPEDEDAILIGPRRITPSDETIPGALKRIDADKLLSRMTYETQPDGKSVLYKLDGEPAFTDHGNRLVMAKGASDHEEKVLSALLTAAQHYHGRIELTGSDAFKSYAISLIVTHNLDVSMKVATQQAELDAARRAAGQTVATKDAVAGNPVSASANPKEEAPLSPVSSTHTQSEPVIMSRNSEASAPVTPPMPEKSLVKPEIHTPAEKAREPVTGKVTACGQAPFRFEKGESESTFITLRTKEGAKTFWGKELAGLLRETRLQPGRMVSLQWQGKQPVTVQVPQKNKDGVVTHYEAMETSRNQWSMTPVGGDRVQTGGDEMVKLSAFDAGRFMQVQQEVVTRLQLNMPAPPVPVDGLYWLRPDGQGSQSAGDALSAARPGINEKSGEPVMSSWAADGTLDLYLVQGDGHYLQGVVRREGEYQHVLVSLPDSKEAPPMVFNLLTPDGAVPLGSGNGINRSNGEPVPRENVVIRLQGDDQARIAKLNAPSDMSPAMHARLGFDERWKNEAGYPKDRPAVAPQAAPVTPQRPA